MAKGLEHEIQDGYGSQYYSRTYLNFVRYGRCLRSPYSQNKLWFVTIVRGSTAEGRDETRLPEEDHTFLVTEENARPAVIQEWKRNIEKWSEVAHKTIKGIWCEHYECLWKDVLVYNHQLPDSTQVKYGYCRTQPRNSERELHFFAFETGSTYVVDHICATLDFIDRMGDDQFKWLNICWCHLEHEVSWQELETGTLEGGYVRANQFALDSPYVPYSLDDLEQKISNYENVVKEYENQRGKKDPQWNSLNVDTKRRKLRGRI